MGRHVDEALVQRIGTRIRGLRLARELTQEQLAEAADMHPETLSRVERGRMQPTITAVSRLAAALGCQVSDLVEDGSGTAEGDEAELLRHYRRLKPGARMRLLEFLGEL